MKLSEVIEKLKTGWNYNRAYSTVIMGQLLEKLSIKAHLNLDEEVEVTYHNFSQGWGVGRRKYYFWEIKNFPEITLPYEEYRPIWDRYDFCYDPEGRCVSFGYDI
jgi:hypothetical protein